MIWFGLAVAAGVIIRTLYTWWKYNRMGLLTGATFGQRLRSYIQAASMDIDLKRARRQHGDEWNRHNRRR